MLPEAIPDTLPEICYCIWRAPCKSKYASEIKEIPYAEMAPLNVERKINPKRGGLLAFN